MRHIADTEAALKQLPESLRTAMEPVLKPLLDFARGQARINLDYWLSHDALPGKHASTHLDGGDTVSSNSDPTAIALTNVASPGTAHHGLSKDDHVHPIGDDIASLTPLTEVTTEDINGYDVLYIYNPATEGLLEEILVELRLLTGTI